MLKKNGFSVTIYYLAYPSQIMQIPYLMKRFADVGLDLIVTGFWGEYDKKNYPDSYTEEELSILNPYFGDRKRIGYNLEGESPKGKLCNSGYKKVVIRNNGDAIRCKFAPEELLGNILDCNFRLFGEPLACNKEFCPYNEFDTVV